MDEKVIVYGTGVCCLSACVSKELTNEEIEKEVNSISPTGISGTWFISEDEYFADNIHKNGCDCETYDDRKHVLLNC